MKEIKVEWCENFIRAAFGKHHPFAGKPDAGIERNCFFKKAEAAGLWVPGVYGQPMCDALANLCEADAVHNDDGDFLYYVFRLAR